MPEEDYRQSASTAMWQSHAKCTGKISSMGDVSYDPPKLTAAPTSTPRCHASASASLRIKMKTDIHMLQWDGVAINLGIRPEHEIPMDLTVAMVIHSAKSPTDSAIVFDKNVCGDGTLIFGPTRDHLAQLTYAFGDCIKPNADVYENPSIIKRSTLYLP